MRGSVVLMLAGLALDPLSTAAAFAEDPPLLTLSTGAADIFDSHQEIYWGVDYRPAFRFFHVGPWLSFGTGKQREFYAAIGGLLDVELGCGWVLTPSFGAGYYSASDGLDLGFGAEFRTAIELAKRFGNGQRLGLCFAHLSNGSLGDENPGTETLGISCSFPLDFLFRRGPAVAVPERTE